MNPASPAKIFDWRAANTRVAVRNPLGGDTKYIIWARSLAGKALRSQRRDRGFESLRVHHNEYPRTLYMQAQGSGVISIYRFKRMGMAFAARHTSFFIIGPNYNVFVLNR